MDNKFTKFLLSLLKAGVVFVIMFVIELAVEFSILFFILFKMDFTYREAATYVARNLSLHISVISNLLTICALMVGYKLLKKPLKSEFCLNVQYDKKKYLFPLVILCGICFCFFITVYLSFIESVIIIPQEWIDILNENSELQESGNVVIRILAIAIVAPVAEEVIFRAGILKYFMQGMPKWIAIILAAMIFGSLHAGPIGFLYATFGGIVLGWLYTLFKSIIPTVIFHISYNAIQLIPINYPVIVIYLLALLFMIVFGIIFYMSKKYELTLNSGESEKNEDIQYSVENN